MKTLGERLRWSRDDAEMTYKQVSEKAGISITVIHRLETGALKGTTHIFALADAVGVDARWLATGEGEPK